MTTRFWGSSLGILLLSTTVMLSCGKKGGDNNRGGDGCMNCGPNGGPGGPGGPTGLDPSVNLSGAQGLLVVESNGGPALALRGFDLGSIDAEAAFALAEDTNDQNNKAAQSMQAVGSDGSVRSAMTVNQVQATPTAQPSSGGENGGNGGDSGQKQNNSPPPMKLPKVLTIAVAPNKEVYLHFAQPFPTSDSINKPECQTGDMWNTPGCQCQLFRIKGGSYETLKAAGAPDAGNLECIDTTHYTNQWQTGRNSVFQFDQDSNVYYPATPVGADGGKTVVYRRTQLGDSTTEVINANICVQDYLVTKAGGVFYTGNTCANGGMGGGGGQGGFFRYAAPSGGGVREIARNWWNFVFEPSLKNGGDQAIFFGPDPTIATTATWNSACLFNFDPAKATATDAISNVITCGADIGSWMNLNRKEDVATYGRGFYSQPQEPNPSAAWKTEYRSRCESSGQVFAGGGSQISAIKQDSTGKVYVIGNLRKKNKGEVTCQLAIKGPHCVVAGIPYVPGAEGTEAYDTSTECSGKGGTWTATEGYCSTSGNAYATASTKEDCFTLANTNRWHYNVVNYNGVASTACFATSTDRLWENSVAENDIYATASSDYNITPKTNTGWWNCSQPGNTSSNNGGGGGDGWTNEYQALGKVDPATKTLVMLSSASEQANRLWLVKDVPYFGTYNTSLGKYYLKRWDDTTSESVVLATDFEAYNVERSGSSSTVYYDGLDFTSNSYSFGTMSTAAPYTRSQKMGLTGTVKTIVILSE